MNKILHTIKILVIGAASAVFNATVFPVVAKASSLMASGALAVRANDQPLNLFGASGIFTTISNTAMFLIGALSVMMLIYGGLRYVISGGDAAKVTSAKNTILYAIVGVVVAILAYAAIDFVTSSMLTNGNGSSYPGTNV